MSQWRTFSIDFLFFPQFDWKNVLAPKDFYKTCFTAITPPLTLDFLMAEKLLLTPYKREVQEHDVGIMHPSHEYAPI